MQAIVEHRKRLSYKSENVARFMNGTSSRHRPHKINASASELQYTMYIHVYSVYNKFRERVHIYLNVMTALHVYMQHLWRLLVEESSLVSHLQVKCTCMHIRILCKTLYCCTVWLYRMFPYTTTFDFDLIRHLVLLKIFFGGA